MTTAPGPEVPDRAPGTSAGTVLVTSVASDAHTWNLVYLQLVIEELGCDVVNLGPCVPDELIISECQARMPALVVVSSVNGHGYQEGLRVIRQLRGRPELLSLPVVIGGKLGITGGEGRHHVDGLLAAGFDAVFGDRPQDTVSLRTMVTSVVGRGVARDAVHELR